MIDATTKRALEEELSQKGKGELIYLCKKLGIKKHSGKNKEQLRDCIMERWAALLEKSRHSGTGSPPSPATPSAIKSFLHSPFWKVYLDTPRGWALLVAVALAISLAWQDPNPQGNDSEQPFDPSQGAYSILILPFAPSQDGTTGPTQMEETIKQRLQEISDQKTLNLQVKINKGSTRPSNFEEGKALGAKLHADLVVWGDPSEGCSTELEACVNYALVNPEPGEQEQTKPATDPLKPGQIQEGKLKGDPELMIQWSLGLQELKFGHWQEALTYFESIKKETAERSFRIGYCHQMLGDHEKASSNYTNAINLNPEGAMAYNNRGLSNKAQNKNEQAIADFENVIRLAGPDHQAEAATAKQMIEELSQKQPAP